MTRRSAIRSVPKLRLVWHQHADQAPDAPEDSIDGEHQLRRVPPHGMTAYFYCCPQRLDVGSFVDPGEWGRILRTYNHQIFSDAWTVLVGELVHEIVRRELFPTKPSRFHCLFLCTSEDGLLDFRAASGRPRDIGYEVELVNPQAQSHLGDWTLPNVRSTDDVATITRHALLYWRGISVANPQLATLSPIRIARRLQRRARRFRRYG